jgi:hypothetical protein
VDYIGHNRHYLVGIFFGNIERRCELNHRVEAIVGAAESSIT